MSQLSDIPLFRGDEGPDEAERWLKTFVDCTGSFSDAGIFRLLFTKFPDGSPAQEWFNVLEESLAGSWRVFRQQFNSRWVTVSRQWRDQLAWDAFRTHVLTENVIFSGEGTDIESAFNAISAWVDDHWRLGSVTSGREGDVVETTKNLLPTFIRIYLQVYHPSPPRDLDQICSNIKTIPRQILDLERVRWQTSGAGQSPSLERKVEEISEKVDSLIRAVGRLGDNLGLPSDVQNGLADSRRPTGVNISSNESFHWEPSSPLTSVVSVPDTRSEFITPVAQSTPLPDHSEDPLGRDGSTETHENILYTVPQEWRQPIVSKTKDELITIAHRAMGFIINSGDAVSVAPCEKELLKSVLANYDRLLHRQVYENQVFHSGRGFYGNYDLLQGIAEVQSYSVYQNWARLSASRKIWSTVACSEPNNCDLAFQLKPEHTTFTWKDQDNSFSLHLDSSGEPSLVGGLFDLIQESARYQNFQITSVRTVLFMALSSYLAECTGENKYVETAVLSAKCVRNWMLDPATSLVKECLINALNVQETDATLSCHLTGIFIEGLCVLASVTRDDTWRLLAIAIATSAMQHNDWHSPDGILIVGADGVESHNMTHNTNVRAFKGLLNRELMIAYEHNRADEPFCNLVRTYINIQFDSLYHCSHLRNSYGIDWRGPYVGPYIYGQIAALDTIVSAIGVSNL